MKDRATEGPQGEDETMGFYVEDDERIPYRHEIPYTPDGCPLEIIFEEKKMARIQRKTKKPSPAREAHDHAERQRKAIKKAIKAHIKDNGLVTNPDTLVDRIHEALFGD